MGVYESKIGALVSKQSEIISSHESLMDRFKVLVSKYKDKKIERPQYWGGYRVIPNMIEFWQSGRHRMHDRFVYKKTDSKNWEIFQLSP